MVPNDTAERGEEKVEPRPREGSAALQIADLDQRQEMRDWTIQPKISIKNKRTVVSAVLPCWDLLEAANDEHGRNNFRLLLGEDQIWYVTSMSPLAFFQKGRYATISPWQFLLLWG